MRIRPSAHTAPQNTALCIRSIQRRATEVPETQQTPKVRERGSRPSQILRRLPRRSAPGWRSAPGSSIRVMLFPGCSYHGAPMLPPAICPPPTNPDQIRLDQGYPYPCLDLLDGGSIGPITIGWGVVADSMPYLVTLSQKPSGITSVTFTSCLTARYHPLGAVAEASK